MRESIFCRRAMGFVAIGTTLVLWPVLILRGETFLFHDSVVFLDQGERIRAVLARVPQTLGLASDANPEGRLLASARAEVRSIQSIPYATFVGAAAPLGRAGVAWLQTALVMVMVYAAIVPALKIARPWTLAGAAVVMLLATPLPFMAAYLMPDILGAIVVLYGAILVSTFPMFDRTSQVAISAIAAFAVATHYGNIPLAAAVVAAAIAILARRGGRGAHAVSFAAASIGVAFGANTLVSVAAFEQVSVAPKRIPVLLARSLGDGPARWYLEDACATHPYAACEFWGDDIPDNVGDALWGPRGTVTAPPELYARIRSEEPEILWRAFRRYPLEQVASLGGNAARQAVEVDSSFARTADIGIDGDGRRSYAPRADNPFADARPAIDLVQRTGYLTGVVVLLALMLAPSDPARQKAAIALVLLGLAANAAIFGGLSAPVARYQARVAWIAPLLAMAFVVVRIGRRAD